MTYEGKSIEVLLDLPGAETRGTIATLSPVVWATVGVLATDGFAFQVCQPCPVSLHTQAIVRVPRHSIAWPGLMEGLFLVSVFTPLVIDPVSLGKLLWFLAQPLVHVTTLSKRVVLCFCTPGARLYTQPPLVNRFWFEPQGACSHRRLKTKSPLLLVRTPRHSVT